MAEIDEGFAVQLDGKPILTPARNRLSLPTRALAELIAGEWNAQEEEIDPVSMPVTRIVNTALDGVALDPQAVKEDILRFAGTDLLCYRADGPNALVLRQAESWDPILEWAHVALNARFVLAEGIVHAAQPKETIAALGAHLMAYENPIVLAGLHSMTTLTGSALLAFGHRAERRSNAEQAWQAAHVDEDWNADQWGADQQALARRAHRWGEMQAADQAVRAVLAG